MFFVIAFQADASERRALKNWYRIYGVGEKGIELELVYETSNATHIFEALKILSERCCLNLKKLPTSKKLEILCHGKTLHVSGYRLLNAYLYWQTLPLYTQKWHLSLVGRTRLAGDTDLIDALEFAQRRNDSFEQKGKDE